MDPLCTLRRPRSIWHWDILSPATELPPLRPAYGEPRERANDVGEDQEQHPHRLRERADFHSPVLARSNRQYPQKPVAAEATRALLRAKKLLTVMPFLPFFRLACAVSRDP